MINMSTIKINNVDCWSNPDKLTTPSLKIQKLNDISYVPLFAGNENEEVQQNNYYYKLNKLKVSKDNVELRACSSARFSKTISDTLSTTITHSGQTGTSVTYPSRTKSGTASGKNTINPGYHDVTTTVSFGVTFTTITSKSSNLTVNSAKNGGTVKKTVYGSNSSSTTTVNWTADWSVTGTVKTTTTTYPSETKSSTASKQVNYGITFSNVPTTLTVDNGCTVANNSGNSSCTVSKTLSGTVEYNKSATLTQNFNVTVGNSV